jgi:hypothetical protein
MRLGVKRGKYLPRCRPQRVVSISTPKRVTKEERTMLDPSDLISFAELAELQREVFHAPRQVRLSRLGRSCDRSRVTALWAQPWPRPP